MLRTIDAHRTLIQFTSTADTAQHFRGKFLDLRTLTFAHTDERGLSLERACDRFAVPYTKREVIHGAPLTFDYITYCREDVTATAALFRAAHIEHLRHPIAVPARHAFSAATIGKGYWEALGITGFHERVAWLDHEVAGWGMAAFYGGRAECRIRKTDVPVVYTDFRSMYMTCNALMDTWTLLTGDQLIVSDNTTEIRRLLDTPDLHERFFDRATWPKLHTLVEVETNGSILPVRARYDPASPTWGIGVNPYTSTRTCWYPLADVIAAVVLGGPKPDIKRAVHIGATNYQPTLKNAKLMGDIEINPKRDDFFTRVVELRTTTRDDTSIDPTHRKRLPSFLKVLANSNGYGILVQYDRKHEASPIPVVVHADGPAFTVTTTQPEDPGTYCAPPIAACVTGAARLMLALLERQVTNLGGTYAFCDTDSMAIVANPKGGPIACPGGNILTAEGEPAVQALTWKQVDQIVERFTALNPYDRGHVPGSILRIEDENYFTNYRGRRKQRRLFCYMISSKRYRLATSDGRIVKHSDHGLGHLLNPTPDGSDWTEAAWYCITNPDSPEPEWLDEPALSRVTVTSPEALAWFATMNRGKPYRDQIKPANFLLIAHPDPLDPSRAQPVAAYQRSGDWRAASWIDRHTGKPVTIRTQPLDGHHRTDTIRVLTYRDVLRAHDAHPETKALASDGTMVRAGTAGVLVRRSVHAIQPVIYMGKEAHDLDNRAHGITTTEDVTTYLAPDADTWTTLTVPVLNTVTTGTIAAATGVHLRTIQRALRGHNTPHPRDRATLHKYASRLARSAANSKRSENDYVAMYAFLQLRNGPESPQNTS